MKKADLMHEHGDCTVIHDFNMKNGGENCGLNHENQHFKEQKWWLKVNQHDGFSHQGMVENAK